MYLYQGEAAVSDDRQTLPIHSAGILSDGEVVRIQAGSQGARFLVLAGKPLREPIVQYGPFVMNTRQEIEQAMADYRDDRLVTKD